MKCNETLNKWCKKSMEHQKLWIRWRRIRARRRPPRSRDEHLLLARSSMAASLLWGQRWWPPCMLARPLPPRLMHLVTGASVVASSSFHPSPATEVALLKHSDAMLLSMLVSQKILCVTKRGLIRLKCIHNFLCSMLVFTPFA
jgi:hypothetical protein